MLGLILGGRLDRLIRLFGLVQKPDIAGHFKTGKQLRIAGLAAHRCLGNAMGLIRRRKVLPILDDRVPVLLFGLHTLVECHVPEAFLQVRLLGNPVT